MSLLQKSYREYQHFLNAYLNFTPQMSLLITSMYIVIDPFATSTSVMANNLFVIVLDKILVAFGKSKLQKK